MYFEMDRIRKNLTEYISSLDAKNLIKIAQLRLHFAQNSCNFLTGRSFPQLGAFPCYFLYPFLTMI